MNDISFLLVFSVFVALIGSGTAVFAQVSNIGSSGEDGVSSNIGSSGLDGVSTNAVPPWIKTSMKFWVEGQTSDAEFLSAVEYLANEEIIHFEAEIPFMAGPIPMNVQEGDNNTTGINGGGLHVTSPSTSTASGDFDTEMISMNAKRTDSFFDVFYESYTVDSFFDIWTELQESTDSFFDVFFEVDTPRTNECLRGQELVFDERTSSWQCASANTVDSFFDVFFDVATESSQNSEDIEELERKIASLEEKISSIEREMKESGEKGGTEDINIGVGELR
ncbi:MAG: ABC transporter C-terminal domain-containing protein [Nitrosopumilaceae archaeon]